MSRGGVVVVLLWEIHSSNMEYHLYFTEIKNIFQESLCHSTSMNYVILVFKLNFHNHVFYYIKKSLKTLDSHKQPELLTSCQTINK